MRAKRRGPSLGSPPAPAGARASTATKPTRSRNCPLWRLLAGLVFFICITMLVVEGLLLPHTTLFALPSATAAPLPVATGGEVLHSASHRTAIASVADVAANNVRPAELNRVSSPPNISVVMPCYGQVAFLEEGLRSVITQKYAPAEIIVVDDGSEDRCGQVAQRLLDGPLAPARRHGVRTLQAWWGWSAADLRRFRDEVVVTPNRGVAHARNTGIRRARGDWICCIDADDTISDSYFLTAMSHVAVAPSTNLVYANQQFFGESKFQWHPPELRADLALVNGPLPLMTLWKRSLWEATPHGFDEALPKGHEDWSFWLQLMRLALHPYKIEDFLVQYRYKANSKKRNRERNNPEVPRLMRTLFPDLYPIRKLLVDHAELLKPQGFSEAVRMDVSVSQHLHGHRAVTHLWRGLILQAKADFVAALSAYNTSRALAEPYDWQGAFRMWRLLHDMGDTSGEADAVAAELRHKWGDAQFAWYSPDVHGPHLNFASAAPGADMTLGDDAPRSRTS